MSERFTPPDGVAAAPVLDGVRFARLLAILADRGECPSLPAPAGARGEAVPLVVIDRPGVFAAGVLLRSQFGRAMPALRARTVTFTLVADSDVMVELSDGSRRRPVAPGESITADFPVPAPSALLTVSHGDRLARCSIALDDSPAPAPAESWTLPGGTGWVVPAPGHTALRCPLVVVEGFPGAHGFLFSHDVVAQQGVLAALQGLGHDLVVIGLDDGTRPLRENAAVVKAGLARVAVETELPVTLLGWSMGGLLARIALAELEAGEEQHRVETLVTWDTPHRGTMTQLGVQWFLANFARLHPAIEPQQKLVASSANRELDMLVLGPDGTPETSPERQALMTGLTWPQRPRRVLLASGRGDGVSSLDPGQVLLYWRGADSSEICLRALGDAGPMATGSLGAEMPPALEVKGQPGWDGMPGGREDYVAAVAILLSDLVGGQFTPARPNSTCTVPTVSALDLDGPPDAAVPEQPDLIACAADHPHMGIDSGAAARLVSAIGAPFDPDRFDPHDPGFLADPFPTYSRFREFAPLHPVPLYQSLWCFRAAECRAILEDTDTWLKHSPGAAAVPSGPMSATAALPPGLFSSDPPAHPVLRTAVEAPLRAALTPVPQMARTRADQILSTLRATQRIELVQDYALPLPAGVLFDLLGIAADPVLRSTLIAWQHSITLAHDATQSVPVRMQGATSSMALRGFFAALVETHRRAPLVGLIGQICDTFAAAGLSDAELEATLCDLLVAGYLSTTFIIATGAWRLLGAPDQLAKLRGDAAGWTGAVEELLRLDGPVQVIDRVAATATTLAGRELPAGTKVTAVVGSADHDPVLFDEPDEVRVGRDGSHMAFGAGVHHCVGAPLARLVAPVALQALFDSAASVALDGEPQWQTDPYLRSVTSLPLALAPASAPGGETA